MNNNEYKYIVQIEGGPEPETPSVATRTQDWIQGRINEVVSSNSVDLISLREAAKNLNVLPLLSSEGNRWYGVRPNGDLISFELQAPHYEHTEEDQWKRTAVLFRVSRDYPQLNPLVPPAPLSSCPCSRCNGSGEILFKGEWVLCICQGLGWIPPMFDEKDEKEEKEK